MIFHTIVGFSCSRPASLYGGSVLKSSLYGVLRTVFEENPSFPADEHSMGIYVQKDKFSQFLTSRTKFTGMSKFQGRVSSGVWRFWASISSAVKIGKCDVYTAWHAGRFWPFCQNSGIFQIFDISRNSLFASFRSRWG